MFAQTFYHGHLRRYVALFGTLFNNIYINREKGGVQYDTIKVPITYAPKEKMMARVDGDPNLNKQVAISLPTMSFELTSLSYDSTRKLSSIHKGAIVQDSQNENRLKYAYNPVPYTLNFSLYIGVKNVEDGTRILEQILPYFTPEWTATINVVPELNIKHDIPTILLDVVSEDVYDGEYTERRAIVWTLDFQMKGYIYGPVKKSEVITLANVNFYATTDITAQPDENVTITPGLLANGSPTTNASLSIERSQIPANSDFGYIVNYESIQSE